MIFSKVASMFAIVGMGAVMGACSQQQGHASAEVQETPPLYVPSTMIVQSAQSHSQMLAYSVLPRYEEDLYPIGRDEKFVYGTQQIAGSTAYSIYTYDQQLISSIWGPSYRYRTVVQNGVTVP